MAAVLSSSMLPAARADYEAEVLSENPVVYYRFDDAVTVDDLDTAVGVKLGSLGTAGDGSFIGTTTRGVPGAITGNTAMSATQPNATAINFIGALNVPNNAALNPSHTGANPFTVECWVKPNTNTSVRTLCRRLDPVLDRWRLFSRPAPPIALLAVLHDRTPLPRSRSAPPSPRRACTLI